MVAFKQTLYVEGVTAGIPRWDALEPEQRVDGFAHLVLVRTPAASGNPAQTIIARLWSSADGKGRDKYPMVALVQGSGVSLDFLLRTALPELEAIEAHCRATSSAQEVVSRLDAGRAALEARLSAEPEGSPEHAIEPSFFAGVADNPQLGPDRQGLLRVLYQLQRELGPRLADGPMGAGDDRNGAATDRAHHLRVPAIGDQATSLRDWATLLLAMLGEKEPMLIAAPAQRPWVDIVLGSPGAGEVFCLRAGESVMPLISTIPYTIEPEFVAAAQQWLSRRASGPAQTIGGSLKRAGRTAALGLAVILAAGQARAIAQAPAPDAAPATSLPVPPAPDPARDAIALKAEAVPGSTALNVAWRRAQRQLLAIYDAGERDRATQLAGQVQQLLTRIDAGIPKGPNLTDLPPSPWLTALADAAATRRERIIRQMVDAWRGNTPAPTDPLVEQQIVDGSAAHTQWLARAETMASQLARLERDLSLGYTLNQSTPAGTLRQIVERWENDVLMTDPLVRDAVRPPLERAAKVATIERSADVDALVATIASSDPPAPIELKLAAWRRLATVRGGTAPWPATPDELKTEASLKAPLTAAIQTIPDPARRTALLNDLTGQQRERFERTISASTDAPAVAAAVEQAPQLGVTQENLSPRVKFNLALIELKKLVSDPATTDAQARAAAEKFIADARALPGGVAFLADAQGVLVPLSGILAGKVTQPASPIPPDLGPAGTGLWRSSIQGDVARFTPTHRGLPELSFVLVPADGQSRDVTFVSTTEVSVGTFASIISEFSSRKQLEQVLPRFDPLTDPRRGVRTWEWAGTVDGIPAIVPAADWLPRDPTVARDVYAPGLTPPAPTRDLPMAQLSPCAALFAARLVNCRLPTPGEWQRAATKYAAQATQPNLRDQTFARQREFLAQAERAGAKVAGIAEAVFQPAGMPDAGATASGDDATLFFRPTTDGSAPTQPNTPIQVRDLVGNVAEWVVLPTLGELPIARPQAVIAYMNQRQDALKVIGGSALSSPAIDPGLPQPTVYADAMEGYADVGFRLAFTVPGAVAGTGMGLAAQIDRLLTPTPMLPPK